MGDVATMLDNGSVIYGEGVPTFPAQILAGQQAVQSPITPQLAQTVAAQTVAANAAVASPTLATTTVNLADLSTWPWYYWAAIAAGAYFLFFRN